MTMSDKRRLQSPITPTQVARLLQLEDPLAYRRLEIQVLENKLTGFQAALAYHQAVLDELRADLKPIAIAVSDAS